MLYCKMSRIWKYFRKSPIFYVPYKVSISLAILNRPFPRAVLKRIFKSKSRRHSYTLFCKFVTPCQFDSGSALSTLSRLRVSFKNRPRCNHLTSSSSFLPPPPPSLSQFPLLPREILSPPSKFHVLYVQIVG